MTAKTITRPLIAICENSDTPSRTRPSASAPITRAPTMVPPMPPLPVEFIRDNLAIQSNVIDASYRNGVERLLFLGSSCIYPRDCPQPIREEYLLTGPLEPTNRPYALAKIAGIEMCWSYNRQYHTQYLAAMPDRKSTRL